MACCVSVVGHRGWGCCSKATRLLGFHLPGERNASRATSHSLPVPLVLLGLNVMGLIPTTRFMACTSNYYVLHFLFVIKVQNYCCSLSSTLIFMIIKFIMHYDMFFYIHIISGQWPDSADDDFARPRRAALSNVRSNASLNHASWCFGVTHFRLLVRFVPALAMHGTTCATDKSEKWPSL